MNPAEEYILNQPEPYKTIILHLQMLIEMTIPSVVLLYKYRLPFYYVENRPYCYINAAKGGYVDLGFWNAAHITQYSEHMITTGRKVMKSLRYKNIEDVDDTVLIAVLKEAYTVRDKKFWK